MLGRQRDVEELRSGLTRWLAVRLPDAHDLVLAPLRTPEAGVSNETFLCASTSATSATSASAACGMDASCWRSPTSRSTRTRSRVGTRQTGVEVRLTDARGRTHDLAGEVLVNCAVWMGRTALKDGITRYRYGDRTGYGIHEHGFVEEG